MAFRLNNYFPTSIAGWVDDMAEGGSAVADFATGALVDTPTELFHFPTDVASYVCGSDRQLGEGRGLGLGPWVSRMWSTFDAAEVNPFSNDNPVLGPVWRAADVVNYMVYGSLDLISAHSLNALFNDHWGMGIKYFTPPPQDARGMGRDIGMVAFIAATPAIKARAYRAVGIEPKPTTPVIEPVEPIVVARPQRPLVPAPLFMVFLNVEAVIRWVDEMMLAESTQVGEAKEATRHKMRAAGVSELVSAAQDGNVEAPGALRALARVGNERAGNALRAFDVTALAERFRSAADVEALNALRIAAEDGNENARTTLRDADLQTFVHEAGDNPQDVSVFEDLARLGSTSSLTALQHWASTGVVAALNSLQALASEGVNDAAEILRQLADSDDANLDALNALAAAAVYAPTAALQLCDLARRAAKNDIKDKAARGVKHLSVSMLVEKARTEQGAVTALQALADLGNQDAQSFVATLTPPRSLPR